MTFSIIARCKQTGQFGAAVSSSSPAVAARCIRARAGIGVAVTQNITDPQLAHILLDMMQYDVSAQDAVRELVKNTDFIEYRQLMALSMQGEPAVYSGAQTLGVNACSIGTDAVCAGNLLANSHVPQAMQQSFATSAGSLAERLLAALQAGLAAGGEADQVHSAGLLVVDKLEWPIIDLRVDWSEKDPIGELVNVWKIYADQVNDYILRALDPTASPSYGVAGDP